MEVTYELTQKDFYEALIAHRDRSAASKWAIRCLMAFAVFIFVIVVFSVAMRPNTKTLSNTLPLLAVVAVWGLAIWGSPWLSARKQFTKQPAAQGMRKLSLDGAGVQWRWDGGTAEIEWKNFIRVVESKNELLIYSSRVFFNIVPKRALAAEQLSELRAILAQNIANKR